MSLWKQADGLHSRRHVIKLLGTKHNPSSGMEDGLLVRVTFGVPCTHTSNETLFSYLHIAESHPDIAGPAVHLDLQVAGFAGVMTCNR